jgi:hypothetical protein
MIFPFTRRWKYIQFIRGKPHNGLKFYCLVDSSFYLWDFWLYKGEDSERSSSPTNIVIDFAKIAIQQQTNKPHIIVANSYYGSLQLHQLKLG